MKAQNAYNAAAACLSKIEDEGVAFSGKGSAQESGKGSGASLAEKAASRLVAAIRGGNSRRRRGWPRNTALSFTKPLKGKTTKSRGAFLKLW